MDNLNIGNILPMERDDMELIFNDEDENIAQLLNENQNVPEGQVPETHPNSVVINIENPENFISSESMVNNIRATDSAL